MSEAIGVTFSITFILSIMIGFGLGILASYCYKKTNTNTEGEHQVEQEGRFYEEVYNSKPPTEEVPMDANMAYASVNH